MTAAATAVGLSCAVAPPAVRFWMSQPSGPLLIIAAYGALLAFLGYLVLAVLPTATPPAVTADHHLRG